MELLHYEFMQRALLAAVLVGITAPAVGVFLVQRRLTLIGDGLGHTAVAGVALGLVLNRSPVVFALLAALVGVGGGRAAADEGWRRRRGGAGRRVLRGHRRRCGAGQPEPVGLSQPERLPLRRHHHDFARRRARLRHPQRRGARARPPARPRAVQREQRRGLRTGHGAAGHGAQPVARHPHGPDRGGVHADRRGAADQRPDGGAGGHRPAVHAQLPGHVAWRRSVSASWSPWPVCGSPTTRTRRRAEPSWCSPSPCSSWPACRSLAVARIRRRRVILTRSQNG